MVALDKRLAALRPASPQATALKHERQEQAQVLRDLIAAYPYLEEEY